MRVKFVSDDWHSGMLTAQVRSDDRIPDELVTKFVWEDGQWRCKWWAPEWNFNRDFRKQALEAIEVAYTKHLADEMLSE